MLWGALKLSQLRSSKEPWGSGGCGDAVCAVLALQELGAGGPGAPVQGAGAAGTSLGAGEICWQLPEPFFW